MNKLSFFLFSLIISQAYITKTVTIQVNNSVHNNTQEHNQKDFDKLGFVFESNASDSRYIGIITSPIGSTFKINPTGEWNPFRKALPKIKFDNEEYRIVEYANGTQRKYIHNMSCDQFIKTVNHEDWILIPERMRHLFT